MSDDVRARAEVEPQDEAADAAVDHEPSPRGVSGRLLTALFALTAIAAFGLVGQLSGAGWFGYRSWLYESGELYVLNKHETAMFVVVDGLKPVEVPPLNARRLDLLGGDSELVVQRPDGTEQERHTVRLDGQNALLKLNPSDCLAIVDIGSYYIKGAQAQPVVLGKIAAEEHLHIFSTRNIVWPTKNFPPRVDPQLGPQRWVEIVGCELFDEPDFLESYLGYRVEEAFTKMREANSGGEPRRPAAPQ